MSLIDDLKNERFVLAPGVYDLVSARAACSAGFPVLYLSGYGSVASDLGFPDCGLATYTEMLSRAEKIVDRTSSDIIADVDTGYGGPLNVRRTVRGYERAGVAAIQIEDQEFPKRCGHTPGRRVIDSEEMCDKIKAAVDARQLDDFLIIARTDARSELGLQEAIYRANRYRECGADLLFIESPESEEELRLIGTGVEGKLVANMLDEGRTPILTSARLQQIGFHVAIYPLTGLFAATHALLSAYEHLAAEGTTSGMPIPLLGFQQFNKLVGFEEVWALDAMSAASREWLDQGIKGPHATEAET